MRYAYIELLRIQPLLQRSIRSITAVQMERTLPPMMSPHNCSPDIGPSSHPFIHFNIHHQIHPLTSPQNLAHDDSRIASTPWRKKKMPGMTIVQPSEKPKSMQTRVIRTSCIRMPDTTIMGMIWRKLIRMTSSCSTPRCVSAARAIKCVRMMQQSDHYRNYKTSCSGSPHYFPSITGVMTSMMQMTSNLQSDVLAVAL